MNAAAIGGLTALLFPIMALHAQPSATFITTLQGTCYFSLPGLPPAPCMQSVGWMVLQSGRSVLLFTYQKENAKKVTFSLSGGQDRQPNLENYYLSIDTLETWFDASDNPVTTDVEGECHFKVAANANRYHSINCTIYNRRDVIMFKFNLNSIFASETKSFNAR